MSTTTAGGDIARYTCHCVECGGSNVTFRGDLAWDVDSQSFIELDTEDWAWCHDCDGEVAVTFKKIKFA